MGGLGGAGGGDLIPRGVVIGVVDVLEMLFRCHGAIDAGMPGLGGAMGGAPADGRCRYDGMVKFFSELQGVHHGKLGMFFEMFGIVG